MAAGAGGVYQVFHVGFGEGLLTSLVIVVAHRIGPGLALLLGRAHAGADTIRTAAVLAVVGEQTRIELGVAGAAQGAGTARRNACDCPTPAVRVPTDMAARRPVGSLSTVRDPLPCVGAAASAARSASSCSARTSRLATGN